MKDHAHESALRAEGPDSVNGLRSKHTPGPWFVEQSEVRSTLCVVSESTWICGELQSKNEFSIPQDEAEANAYLIAAAPDLLVVLMRIRDSYPGYIPDFIEAVNAAIAKATGGAQ